MRKKYGTVISSATGKAKIISSRSLWFQGRGRTNSRSFSEHFGFTNGPPSRVYIPVLIQNLLLLQWLPTMAIKKKIVHYSTLPIRVIEGMDSYFARSTWVNVMSLTVSLLQTKYSYKRQII